MNFDSVNDKYDFEIKSKTWREKKIVASLLVRCMKSETIGQLNIYVNAKMQNPSLMGILHVRMW